MLVQVTLYRLLYHDATGIHIRNRIVKRREGDIPAMYADNSKIVKELGWKPKHTLEDMVKSSFKFQTYLNTL